MTYRHVNVGTLRSPWGSTYSWINQDALLVNGVLSSPEIHALNESCHTGLLAWSCGALGCPFVCANELALDAESSLLDSIWLDHGGLCAVKSAEGPFRNASWSVDGCEVGCFNILLGDDINDTLSGLQQILQCILRSVHAACKAKHKHWWVVVNHVEVAERRKIAALPICADCGSEANGTWYDGRDEHLVVVYYRPTFTIRIDLAMLFLE